MLTKDDVQKALGEIDEGLDKSEDKKDLNSANGAATEEGSLKSVGEDMNKEGKKKGEVKAKKSVESFTDDLPEEVETKVEVSSFLKALVDHTADRFDGLRDYVAKSDEAMEVRSEEIQEGVEDVQKSLQNIAIVLKAVCERIGILENEPESQKSVTRGNDGERNFHKSVSAEEGSEAVYKSLNGKAPGVQKSMISTAMIDLVQKGRLSDLDVVNFETYGHVSPEADVLLRGILN